MKAVWKYPLEVLDEQCIPVLIGSQFISVMSQDNRPVVYFLADIEESSQNPVEFRILGTGHEKKVDYLDGFRFIGTIQAYDGFFVWHIWMNDSRIRGGE